jgi:hypothetical protein
MGHWLSLAVFRKIAGPFHEKNPMHLKHYEEM